VYIADRADGSVSDDVVDDAVSACRRPPFLPPLQGLPRRRRHFHRRLRPPPDSPSSQKLIACDAHAVDAEFLRMHTVK
jgi:hypothetical protein